MLLLLQVFSRFCRIQRQTSSSQLSLDLRFHFHNHLPSRSLRISKPSLFTTDLFIRSQIDRFLLLSNQQVALRRSTFQDEAFHTRLPIGGSVHGYRGCLPSAASPQLVNSSSPNPFFASSSFCCNPCPWTRTRYRHVYSALPQLLPTAKTTCSTGMLSLFTAIGMGKVWIVFPSSSLMLYSPRTRRV